MTNIGYPEDWEFIATTIKEKANWRCQKCGRIGIRPGEKLKDLTKSSPRAYIMQVHHWDRDTSNNCRTNLVCLCPPCHLLYHNRKQSNISPGQLALFKSEDYLIG